MVSSTFVAAGMHASARPPDPHETLRGRMNFKLRACCDGPNIGRKLASKAARRRVHAGNAIGKGPEATQEGQLGARDCQLGAPNRQQGGQDGQLGSQDGPTWRSELFPSASWGVPGTTRSAQRRPKPIFHIDFSSIFERFVVGLRSSRLRRSRKIRISKRSRVILTARLGSCVVQSLRTARTSFEMIFELYMFSLFSLRTHKPT